MYTIEDLQKHHIALDANFSLLAKTEKESIIILSMHNKQNCQKISTYIENPIQLFFIPHSDYLLAGTKTGRIMLYNCKYNALVFRLYSFRKKSKTKSVPKLTAAAFYQHYLAIGSSHGSVVIFNRNSHHKYATFQIADQSLCALSFLDEERLIAGTSNGEIIFFTLDKNSQNETIQTSLTHIAQILPVEQSNFLLFHNMKKNIALFDTANKKIISYNFMTFSENIAYISLLDRQKLRILFHNKTERVIDFEGETKLASLIKENEISKAYALLEKEPWLKESKESLLIEQIYQSNYAKALDALRNKQEKKAQSFLETYLQIPQKKEAVAALFKDFRSYERLKELVAEEKYTLAYALCEKFPSLQHTKEYQKMEKKFSNACTNAQKQMHLGKYSQAKDILFPFSNIQVKKNMIDFILKINDDFLSFLHALEEKNFPKIEALSKKHPQFKEIFAYKDLQQQIQTELQQLQKLINSAKIEEALSKIKELEQIPAISHKLKQLHITIISIKPLLQYYKENNFKKCYEIVDTNNHIFAKLELYKLLEDHWEKLMKKCEIFALNSDVSSIKHTLQELIEVKTRSEKTGDLLRIAFLLKIIKEITNGNYTTAQGFIYSYIDIFGTDVELKYIMSYFEQKSHKKLAITLEQNKTIMRNSWMFNELIVYP